MGGQDKLTQLIDPERTGVWDAATAEIARQDACNQILASAGIHAEHVVDVTEFRDKFPHLVTVAAQLAIVLLWDYGTSGQARLSLAGVLTYEARREPDAPIADAVAHDAR
jgi:hypothetical protein